MAKPHHYPHLLEFREDWVGEKAAPRRVAQVCTVTAMEGSGSLCLPPWSRTITCRVILLPGLGAWAGVHHDPIGGGVDRGAIGGAEVGPRWKAPHRGPYGEVTGPATETIQVLDPAGSPALATLVAIHCIRIWAPMPGFEWGEIHMQVIEVIRTRSAAIDHRRPPRGGIGGPPDRLLPDHVIHT